MCFWLTHYSVHSEHAGHGVPDHSNSKASHMLPAPCSINNDYSTTDHSISKASYIFPAPCSINNDYSTPDHSISNASHMLPAPCSINNDYSTQPLPPQSPTFLEYSNSIVVFYGVNLISTHTLTTTQVIIEQPFRWRAVVL